MSSKSLFIVSNRSTSGSMTYLDHLQDFAPITALVISRWQLSQCEVDWIVTRRSFMSFRDLRMTVGNRPLHHPTSDTDVRGYHFASKSRVWNDGSQNTISVLFLRYTMPITSWNSSMAGELGCFSDRFDPGEGLFISESYSCRLGFQSDHHIHLKSPHQSRAAYVRMLMTPTSCLTYLRDGTFHLPPWHHSYAAMALTAQPAMKGQQRC
jgi:hypothetical protein